MSATCSQILQCALGLSYDELGGHASWFCKAALMEIASMEIALRHRSTVSGSIDQRSKRDAARIEGVEPGNATIEHQLLADIVVTFLNANRRSFQRHVHLGKEKGGGGGGRSSNARPFRWILNPSQEFTCVLALKPATCNLLEGTCGHKKLRVQKFGGLAPNQPTNVRRVRLGSPWPLPLFKASISSRILERPQVRKKNRPIYEARRRRRFRSRRLRPRHRF